MKDENTQLQVREKNIVTLQEMVDEETNNRHILTAFITNHMKEGTDFGKIKIGNNLSKPSLFKAGAEKFASLMKLRADVVKDEDTWEMSGRKEGLFCYKANLYNQKGEIVGMGLGACSLQEKSSYNNAIKIGKKRAFVDAILTTGALSDFFTQDLEDMDQSTGNHTNNHSAPTTSPQNSSYSTDYKITYKQILFIKGLLDKKGFSLSQLYKKYAVKEMEELSGNQASSIIKNLQSLPDNPTPTLPLLPKEEKEEEEIRISQPELSDKDLDTIDEEINKRKCAACGITLPEDYSVLFEKCKECRMQDFIEKGRKKAKAGYEQVGMDEIDEGVKSIRTKN